MFQSARLQLTLWYVLICMCISVTFSLLLFRVMAREVIRFEQEQRFRIERRLQERFLFETGDRFSNPVFLPENAELISATRQRVVALLAVVNGCVFLLAGGVGYLLAGRTLRPLQEMVEEQNRFVGDASHELRTPLTALKTSLEVYLRDPKRNKADADALAADGLREVNKLQALSESLLKSVQYPTLSQKPEFAVVPLNDVLHDAIRSVSPQARQKNIHVSYEPKSATVWGHAPQLTELCVILLDNAIKYSPEGSTVSVHIKKRVSTVEVMIKDKGQGIAEADLPHVFDRFYRADDARTKEGSEGYGLGLSIAKRITHAHNGAISLTSKVGKGTTVHVFLPPKGRFLSSMFQRSSSL